VSIEVDTILLELRVARPITLAWHGKSVSAGSTPSPPLRRWEARGGSALLQGDNLAMLGNLRATHAGQVSLVYLDPPFLTNRVHEAKNRKTGLERVAFDDRWVDRAAYLEALGPRLVLLRELLAPHGSIVIHVDPKTSHYVKVLADEVFGEDAFASEIVWRYRRWPSKTDNFQRVHDVLLRYRKDPNERPRWNTLYEPLAASTVATWGTNKQRAVFDADGKRARSSSTDDPTHGVPMGDVWEIGVLAPVSRERTGYPSQKPEALLDRLVTALSDPGDLVLDPYAGSGTTLVVAAKRGRRFVGIDQSEVAIDTTLARLAGMGVVMGEAKAPAAVPCAGGSPKPTVRGAKGPSLPRSPRPTRGTDPKDSMPVSRAR
jgi:DNA modification methylase